MALALGDRMDLRDVQAIYTSDLRRARDSAVPLSKRLGIPITMDPDLREGNWENHFVDPTLPPLPFHSSYENDQALTLRAVRCLGRIAQSESRTPVLIVTHSGFFRSFFRHHFPDRIAEYAGIRTALNRLRYEAGHWRIVSLNDEAHLHADKRLSTSLDHG